MIVWIVSYPRSGNTFFRSILKSVFSMNTYSVYNDGQDISANPNLAKIIGHEHFDFELLEEYRNSSEIYFIKTHEIDVKIKDSDKVIYLIRDGREATLSFMNYLNNYEYRNVCFSDVLDGCHSIGNWSNHILSWLQGVRKPDLIIRFEKLITNPHEIAKKVSSLLNLEQKTNEIHNFESLQSIDNKFFFSGKIDSWKNIISQDEHHYYWLHSYDAMILSEYQNHMPSLFSDKLGSKLHTLFIKNKHQLPVSKNDVVNDCDNTLTQLQVEQEKLTQALRKLNNAQQEIENLNAQLLHLNNDNELMQQKAHDLSVQYRNFVVAMHAWQSSPTLLAYLKLKKLQLPEIPEIIYPTLVCKKLAKVKYNYKISIITPSFNSGDSIERAILSVSKQSYKNWEHIIIDGGSTDNTIDIIKKYPHLKWISEPDNGQVDAMNKGFAMSSGEIISYLNADDYYLEDAFLAVINFFDDSTSIVYGKVKVFNEESDSWWVNDPKYDIHSVIRHWEADAFCVNPVGYFYKKEVQESIPYQEKFGAKMDLAFLMQVALKYGQNSKKVGDILGVFMNTIGTRTAIEQSQKGYWTPENFPFIDEILLNFPEEYRAKFKQEQENGYKQREEWRQHKPLSNWKKEDSTVFFPATEYDMISDNLPKFCNPKQYKLTKGDTVIVVLTYGKCGSSTITKSLEKKLYSKNGNIIPVYHLHGLNKKSKEHIHNYTPWQISSFALRDLFDQYKHEFNWCFIYGVREFIGCSISGYFETEFKTYGLPSDEKLISHIINKSALWVKPFNSIQYKQNIGIDLYSKPFDKNKGYQIIKQENISILTYRMDKLNDIFSEAMYELIGFKDIKMIKANISADKTFEHNGISCADAYAQTKANFKLDRDKLVEMYNHEFMTHYFTDDEISGFIEKYSNKNINELSKLKKEDSTVFFPATEYDMYRDNSLSFCNPKQYRLAKGDTIIVILVYEKCGSSTITRSLERGLYSKSDNAIPAYHLHGFNKKSEEQFDNYTPWQLSSFALRDLFDKYKNDFNWRFINGVREFIGCSISSYFENKFNTHGLPNHKELISYINDYALWVTPFNSIQYKQNVGIDLYSKPFDKNKGYQIIKQDNISVLTYRMDKLNDIFSEAMYELIGFKDIKMIKANISADKTFEHNGISCADAYAQTKANFKLDRDKLVEMYNHEFMTHYFTDDEISGFIEKYSK